MSDRLGVRVPHRPYPRSYRMLTWDPFKKKIISFMQYTGDNLPEVLDFLRNEDIRRDIRRLDGPELLIEWEDDCCDHVTAIAHPNTWLIYDYWPNGDRRLTFGKNPPKLVAIPEGACPADKQCKTCSKRFKCAGGASLEYK